MKETRCAQCNQPYDEDELIPREDTGELICPDCSGLLKEDNPTCPTKPADPRRSPDKPH